MTVAMIKDGMVINKINVPDGVQLVPLKNLSQAQVFDLYDGEKFSTNPDAVKLKVVQQKKHNAINEITKSQTEAELKAAIASADAAINP